MYHKRIDIVKRLLGAGANVNARDERVNGDTPLAESVETGMIEVGELLLAAGVDPTIRGWMGQSALDRAKNRKPSTDRRLYDLLNSTVKATQRRRA